MPLDAICLSAISKELMQATVGSRIEKVYQPEREEIILALRGSGGAKKLLISASASAPRVHFLDKNRENPAAPPMFCMLMRKHVQGSKIVSITQPNLERMLVIELDGTDEMGVPSKKYLQCELMGRFANIVLTDSEGRILDSLKRVDGDVATGKRQVLPGLFYRLPPAQEGKLNLFEISIAGVGAALKSISVEKSLDKWILSNFLGMSPLIARELAYRAIGDNSKIVSTMTDDEIINTCKVLENFVNFIKNENFAPYIMTKEKDVFDFTFMPITQYENLVLTEKQPSFSDMLRDFYEKKVLVERKRRHGQDMLKTITTARDRLERKLGMQQQELEQTKNRDLYKRQGELITANLYQLKKGARVAKVIDYYDENCPEVEIELDLRLDPQANAQKYFKLYNKAKTAEQILTSQIEIGTSDLAYLESVLVAVDECENEQDLEQLREELRQTGYLQAKKAKYNHKQKSGNSKPYHYKTSDGFDVFAGKNNIQNDLLTLKTAYKGDIWFHTQKIHGSHVILIVDGKEPTNEAMTEAAEIAAYHSKGKGSSMVPVDYSEVRNIKKPNGAKPGMVIYHVYKTAFVTPHEEKIEKLRIN